MHRSPAFLFSVLWAAGLTSRVLNLDRRGSPFSFKDHVSKNSTDSGDLLCWGGELFIWDLKSTICGTVKAYDDGAGLSILAPLPMFSGGTFERQRKKVPLVLNTNEILSARCILGLTDYQCYGSLHSSLLQVDAG
jgi:hypothetical protein